MIICYECGTILKIDKEELKLYNFIKDDPNWKDEFDIDYDICPKCAELSYNPIVRNAQEQELISIGKKIFNIKAEKYENIPNCNWCHKCCALVNGPCKEYKLDRKKLLDMFVKQNHLCGFNFSRVLWKIFNRLKTKGWRG